MSDCGKDCDRSCSCLTAGGIQMGVVRQENGRTQIPIFCYIKLLYVFS